MKCYILNIFLSVQGIFRFVKYYVTNAYFNEKFVRIINLNRIMGYPLSQKEKKKKENDNVASIFEIHASKLNQLTFYTKFHAVPLNGYLDTYISKIIKEKPVHS